MKSALNRLLIYFLVSQGVLLCLLSYVNHGDAITLSAARNFYEGRILQVGKPCPDIPTIDIASKRDVNVNTHDGSQRLLIFINCSCQIPTAQNLVDGAAKNGELPSVFVPETPSDANLSLAGKNHSCSYLFRASRHDGEYREIINLPGSVPHSVGRHSYLRELGVQNEHV